MFVQKHCTTEGRLAMSALKRLKIDYYFDFLQTCNTSGLQKGDRRYFDLAVERLGYESKDIWVFEDAYHCIKSAKSVGLNIVAIEDESALEDRERIKKIADIYISSYNELALNDL